jgi:hypothetical protein
MPKVTTSLGPLHVEDLGSGPPVVMWPSLFCDGSSLRAQRAHARHAHRRPRRLRALRGQRHVLIPGARLEVIDGTAHLSGWEAPARVNALLRAFITSPAVAGS